MVHQTHDISCNISATVENDVDISFTDVSWYSTLVASDRESDVCFFAGLPTAQTKTWPPARHDLINDRSIGWGKLWGPGFLEGERDCDDPGSFTVDFNGGGIAAKKPDGTEWGSVDGTPRCGKAEGEGMWQVWYRESTARFSWRRADWAWVDAEALGESQAGLEDDGIFTSPLPFAFPFFDSQYTTVNVSSNGYLTFSDDTAPYGNTRQIPYHGEPENVLMALWSDLNPADLPTDRRTLRWLLA